jgi:hypothetical protein
VVPWEGWGASPGSCDEQLPVPGIPCGRAGCVGRNGGFDWRHTVVHWL